LKTPATANAGAAPIRDATFSRRPDPRHRIRWPNERTKTCQITDTSQVKTTPAGAGPAARSRDPTGDGSRGPGPKARVSRARIPLGGRAARVGTTAAADDDSRVPVAAGPSQRDPTSRARSPLGGRRAADRSGLDPGVAGAEPGPRASPAASASAGLGPPGRGRVGRGPLGNGSPGHDPAVFGRTGRA